MAACLITVSGTSGEVLIRYTQSSIDKEIVAPIGTLYLDDATVDADITYTTLSGDAIAASSCFTVTALPLTCYHFTWNWLDYNYPFTFVELILDSESFELSPTVSITQLSFKPLADSINALNNPRIKAIQGQNDFENTPNFTLVLQTLTNDLPKLTAVHDSISFQITAEAGDCNTVGFENVNTCQS